METLLDQPYGKLLIDEDRRYLKMVLIGNIEDTDYKHIWDFGLEKAIEYNCPKLLADQRQIGFVKMTSRAWLLLKWMPRSKKSLDNTRRKLAVLPSKHIAHRAGMNYLIEGLKRIIGHYFEFFETEEEAIQWLTKKD